MSGQQSASPPTARVVDVVEALVSAGADHPTGRWTLAEVVATTGMTRATAHAVLATLVERAWVERDDAKTYAVGPALRLLARDLAAPGTLDQLAHDAAAKVAAATGHTTVVVRCEDGAVVVGDVAAAPGRTSAIAVGSRVPYLPPFGPGFAAWADHDEQEAWVGHAERINPALAERLRRVLPAIRRRGHSLERFDPASASVFEALALLQDDALGDAVREVLGTVLARLTKVDFTPAELRGRHAVTAIAAPVFDAEGRVVRNLALQPRGTHAAAELTELGRTLVEAADTVTESSGGRRP